jgi:hypothetical protein
MYSTDTDKQFVDFDKLQNWISQHPGSDTRKASTLYHKTYVKRNNIEDLLYYIILKEST